MGSTKRILGLVGLLAMILIVPAGPVMGQAADPLAACAEMAFSTEEDFITHGPVPLDGNHLISDGDLLGAGCVVCLRNWQLLDRFEVEEDLGLDAADVINIETGLVAFSTELDHPRGVFKAGDLLTTHGAVIPNLALLYQFDLPRRVDLGLDAVHFVGDLQGINAFLDYAVDVGREQWLSDPDMLSAMLEEFGIDILLSTEGTAPWPEDPGFLDGDLLSVLGGAVAIGNDALLPSSVPAGIPRRGVDFGLDAVTADRSGDAEVTFFSTEILFNGDPAFTDGDVLLVGTGLVAGNQELTGCFEPKADDLGLDALFIPVGQGQQQTSVIRRTPSQDGPAAAERAEEPTASVAAVEQAVHATSSSEDHGDTLCDLFPFACTTFHDARLVETEPLHLEQPPLAACRERAFSTEEEFITYAPVPLDGNPIISDGDLLGPDCEICARNRELLTPFKVEVDLGLDAADVIDVDTELVAFSTELDDPNGQFTAGDLLATNGAAIPNQALLWAFKVDYDIGLDAVYFVGPKDAVVDVLSYAARLTREEWLADPQRLAEMLEEAGLDLWFSTEGTPLPLDNPQFLDGDLLSVVSGNVVEQHYDLLPPDVPAGWLDRGIDFGLDAVGGDRSDREQPLRFSTEILYRGERSFTDGDVLVHGDWIEWTNLDLISPCSPVADFLGLDAYSFAPPCEPSIEVEKQVLKEAEVVVEPVDIMFAFDATGSMGDEIDEVKESAAHIMSHIRSLIADSRFGLASFADYPQFYADYCGYSNQYGLASVPDWPYRLDQALTTDIAAVQGAIGSLALGNGADLPEDYARALWELGVNDVADVGWRANATKIVIMFGDAPTHDCDFYAGSYGGDPGPDGVAGNTDDLDFESVVAQLAADDVIVLSVDSSNNPGGDAEKSFKRMAYQTGGAYYALSEAAEIPQAVEELVTSVFGTWVDQITSIISDTVRFRCTIHNNSACCPLSRIVTTDVLPPSLEYRDNATVNGVPWEPERIDDKTFKWDLGEWVLDPSESVDIEFDAHVAECGEDVNKQVVEAVGCGQGVSASDTARVLVPCEPSIEVEKQVWQPAEEVVTPVDIVFAFDATGSMGDEIDEVKESAAHIMSDIRAVIADSRFGLASFADYPQFYTDYCGYSNQYGIASVPDWPYRLDRALTTDIIAVQGAIGSLALGNGADLPEDYARALWELGVNDVADVGWRADATKIVIMFGDAPTHDCDFYASSYGGDPGPDALAGTRDDLNFESVVAQLGANDVIVLSVDSSNNPGGDAEKSFKYMASKTGGAYYALSEAGEIPMAVEELVTKVFGTWVDEITSVISDTVRFRCTIHNNGIGCPLSQIVASDLLPSSLEYRDNATVNGEPWEPEQIGDKEFVWDLGRWVLNPSERIEIEFDAHVAECGEDVNKQVVQAVGCEQGVSASDTATVLVPCEPSIEVEKQVWQPAEEVVTPVDVMFAFDATGSMGDEIDEVKASATNIMSDIRAVIADSRFGLTSFSDYPKYYTDYCGYSGQYGNAMVPDWPYRLDRALTTDIPAVQGAIGALTLGHGKDEAEDYTRALWELGVNDVADVGWRADATKIVIMFGDAPTHDCNFYAPTTWGGDPGPDGAAGTRDDLDFEAVVAQLAAEDIIVLSVDSLNEPGGDAEKSFKYMAYKTGGAYYALSDAGEIPKAVKELVTNVFGTWVDQITAVVSDTVRFRCTIHNDGTGCPLSQIVATDLLPPSLEYRDNATINGEPWEPTAVAPKEFVWDLGRWVLNPSETIEIEFDAHVTETGVDTNTQKVEAIGCGQAVSDLDTATVVSSAGATLYIEPASATTSFSGTTTVDIRIRDVTDLYGVQLYLSFDPDILEVEDAIPGGNVNIVPGDFLDPGAAVQENYVNNSTGEIKYAQSRSGPMPGVDGSGVVARITFHGKAVGTSDLTFTLHILGDPFSVPIDHEYVDGEIVVSSAVGTVQGKVILERRVNYPNANAGVTVRLASQSLVTGDNGSYSFSGVPAGTHHISATHPSYLPTWRSVDVTAGATTTLPDVTMLGGDCGAALPQGEIYGEDHVAVNLAWGTSPGDPDWNPRADIRDDNVIDVLDLTAVKFNWLKAAPGFWPGSAAQVARPQLTQPSLASQAATQATIVISPTVITTSIGSPATVDVWVQDVDDLYGGGFQLDFNPSVVKVQDANPFEEGVQIELGSWLARQQEAANSVDNATGEIDYFVSQSRPATAKDGSGILARMTFVGVANGSSDLQFTRQQLVDDEETIISATTQDGQVVVAGGAHIYLPLVLRGS